MSNQDNRTHMAGEAEVNQGLQYFQQKKYEEGFQAFMKAALKGHPGAMNNIAYCFYNGQGTAVDKTASFVWMKKAAEGGFTPAYFALAVKYLRGDGTDKSLAEAVRWAKRADVEGNMHQESAHQLLEQIDKMIQNSPAVKARQAAANEVNKGMEFVKEKKYKEAFNCFMSAAMQGDLNAMNNVSLCFASGQGVEKNEVHAFNWMKRAAEGGLTIAFFAMADKYLNGKGTERSLEQAQYWAKKAAEVKNPFTSKAQAVLKIIENELSFAPEIREALTAGNDLWNKQDYAGALKHLEIAARGGHAAALRLIGFAYLNGLGVERDASCAYQFLEAAAYRGDQLAVILIIRSFTSANKVALWQFYGQKVGVEGADRIVEEHIVREQKVKRGYCQALNAQEAMVQAAQHMKAAKEQAAVAAQNPNIGIILARPALEKAVNYGCLDGVCGLAEVLGKTGNMELERVSTDMYRIAAYMGHSYAMYQMGQYYDEISKETADACYRQAALWEYQPAVDVCAERNISLG